MAFKGILGHAGIFSYLKLCQPKQTQFPCGSMWSPAHSVCFSLILAFSLFNWENKVGPGAQTDPVQMAVSKLVPTVPSRRRDEHFNRTVNFFWSSFLYVIRKPSLWPPSPVLLTSLGALPSTRPVFGSRAPVGYKVKKMFTFLWSELVLIICWELCRVDARVQSCCGWLEGKR